MDKAWVGIDAGKEFHWAHALDASGAKLFSRRVENDEGSLSALIDELLCLAGDLVWAIDHSPVEARPCSWRCCGSVNKRSSTFPAWSSTAPATPTVESPNR